jgi:outer membrane immunogenic protein
VRNDRANQRWDDRMKTMLFAGFALATSAVSMTVPGEAADLGSPSWGRPYSPPAPVYAPQPFSWSGFYFGIQGGRAWGGTEAQSGPYNSGVNQSYDYGTRGFLGGVHAGYNWQAGNVVFGVETDLEKTNLHGTGYGNLGYGNRTTSDWQGSLRGRLGYAVGQTMIYGTGGLAYGDVNIDKSLSRGQLPFASYSEMRTGWTLGAGVEHAFTPNITARIEYRYTDLGEGTFNSATANSGERSDTSFNAVRAGLSFKF